MTRIGARVKPKHSRIVTVYLRSVSQRIAQRMGVSAWRFSIEDEGRRSGARSRRAVGHLKRADCRRTARLIIKFSLKLETGSGERANLKRQGRFFEPSEGESGRGGWRQGTTRRTRHVPASPLLHVRFSLWPALIELIIGLGLRSHPYC